MAELKPAGFLEETFNETDGKTSFGRMSSFLAFAVVAAGVLFVTWKTHVFQIPSGSTEFIAAPYAVNKLSGMVGRFADRS